MEYRIFALMSKWEIKNLKHRTPVIVAIFLVILGVSSCTHQSRTPADTVLIHAEIYTVNKEEPRAQAIAIREGKIVAVGSDEEIAAYQGASTKIIDAKKHMVLPGFVDAHVHILAGASQLEQVSLNDAKTLDDFQKLVKDHAVAHPEKKWIQGMGWYYSIFGRNGLPDKKFVDEVVSDRPVYLLAYDGHSSLANRRLDRSEKAGGSDHPFAGPVQG
jgi:predicted amidohydrolase YtcJ